MVMVGVEVDGSPIFDRLRSRLAIQDTSLRGHRERDGHGLSTEPQPSLDPSSE